MSQATLPQDGPLPLTNAQTPWEEAGYHPFLFNDHGETDPVRVMLDIRSGIRRLPETAATFTLKDVLDEHRPHAVQPEYMQLVGSWKVPQHVSPVGSKTGANHWANPNYPDAHLYSDAIVRCRCGNAFLRPQPASNGTAIERGHDHADDCKPYDRMRARADLAEKREQIIIAMSLLDVPSTITAKRLGLECDSAGNVAEQFDIVISDLRERGRQLTAQTCRRLFDRHDAVELAAVYNKAPNTISRYIRERTTGEETPLELASRRRRNSCRDAWTRGGR